MKNSILSLPLLAMALFSCKKQDASSGCFKPANSNEAVAPQARLSFNLNDTLPLDSARILLQNSLNEDFSRDFPGHPTVIAEFETLAEVSHNVRINGTSLEPSNTVIIPQALEASNSRIMNMIRDTPIPHIGIQTISVEALCAGDEPMATFKAYVTFAQ